MNLKTALRSSVAAACIVSTAAPASAAAPVAQAVAARGGMDVRVAQTETFSRVEVRGGRATMRREGQTVTLTFDRDADPDIARLRTSPPKWIKGAEKRHAGGRLQLIVILADDADAKFGMADGGAYLNAFEKTESLADTAEAPVDPAAPPVEVAEPEPVRPDPRPVSGVVKVDAKVAGEQVRLGFTWANPAGAAVFRRGEALWIIFDADANLDLSEASKGLAMLRKATVHRGADHVALRLQTPRDTAVFASSEGVTWTVVIGPGTQSPSSQIRVFREDGAGPASLKAPVAGATRIINLADPTVGDVLTVVTALGPPKGVPGRREYVQMALLPSVQGMAIQPRVEDLEVVRDGELIRMGRAAGLALSPVWAGKGREKADLGAPKAAVMPALISEDWGKLGPEGFLPRYAALTAAAAAEGGGKAGDATANARMALARFLVGSELYFEAIGVLNDIARDQPKMLDDPELRGLRGLARTQVRRYAEADTDFASPVLANDPSAALWRAYVNAQLSQWAEARAQFVKGAEAYNHFAPVWRSRFARSDAKAALELGDNAGAEARIRMALEEHAPAEEQLQARLVQARVIELQGGKRRALNIYKAIGGAPFDYLSAPAVLRATQIRLELGEMTPLQAAGVYDGLRYRWRGDSTELETIRALGQLYLTQGRYREAMEALHSAGSRLPNLPEAQQLQADLAAAFRALFMDGLADGLEPVQALALFYDFRELTPIGADGDMMVRKLVRRLVDVDLLSQAAELLKYQVENRLDGIPRAQVATDLAVIHLMDRKPEQALEAINGSRTTVLPQSLALERRLIEARAWSGVGRHDSALEIIERDNTKEAQDLRGEITWKQKSWALAGPIFEKSLGDRWKSDAPLTTEEEGRLLRAGVAYSLSGDEEALGRLEARYSGFYDKASNPDALRVALSGLPSGRLSVSDFGRVSADNAIFTAWVDKMKGRFKTRAAPVGTAKAPAAAPPPTPARQAQAPKPPVSG